MWNTKDQATIWMDGIIAFFRCHPEVMGRFPNGWNFMPIQVIGTPKSTISEVNFMQIGGRSRESARMIEHRKSWDAAQPVCLCPICIIPMFYGFLEVLNPCELRAYK
jgi:hypothetical protein